MNNKKQGARLGEVTIVKGCMICQKEEILLATKDQRQPLPPKDSTLPKVCEDCRKKYLVEGILIINPNTGRLIVLKEEAFKQIFSKFPKIQEVLEHRICYSDDEVINNIEGMQNGKQNKQQKNKS